MENATDSNLVENYLNALKSKEVSDCVKFFNEDAIINFQSGVFQGKKGIAEWHQNRFDVNFEVLNLEDVSIDDNKITIYAAITSDRIKAWKMKQLHGKMILDIENGKIQKAKFGLRITNPLENWS